MDDFCVKDQDSLSDAIQHLHNNKMFTDLTVVCSPGNEEFYVHKLLVALHTPVLSDMFFGDDKIDYDKLHIEGIAISAVTNMICHFYGEPLIFEDISQITETKKIAEKYKINELSNICKTKICEVVVDVSNVLTVLEMAMEYKNEDKEKECLKVINQNKESVFASETFLKMKFPSVCQIFDKLQQMGGLTEVQYLRSALRWTGHARGTNKEKIMKKIQISKLRMDEFIDIIISFPNLFTNAEISHALKEIKSVQEAEQESTGNLEVQVATSETNIEVAPVHEQKSNTKKSKLIINILNGEESLKQAIVTVEDEIGSRSLQFEITGDLKEGIFASLSQENAVHTFDNVDISYEGLYFMMACLRNNDVELSSVNYIEVLKAAVYFQVQKLQDFCLMKIGNIIDYDPVFLDGLRHFPFFEDRLLDLLNSEPRCIILHPHFISCSIELIEMLLNQDEMMNLPSESQLLIVTITWLEARNRLQWNFRSSLLNKIAFENISYSDLEFVVHRYPNFFADNEINPILLFKTNNAIEDRAYLPEWYNFKSRRFVLSQSEKKAVV